MDQPQKRVLVVDDDDEIRLLLQSLLAAKGLSVDVAPNGSEALQMMAERRYAVILLDLIMPVLDGFGVLGALGTTHRQDSPVVIVLTGAAQSVVGQLDPRLVHGIVKKPFDPGDIAQLASACAEIRAQSTFERMAIAAAIAGGPFVAFLAGRM